MTNKVILRSVRISDRALVAAPDPRELLQRRAYEEGITVEVVFFDNFGLTFYGRPNGGLFDHSTMD